MSRHCALCRHCGLEADEHPCCECWRDPSHPMFSRDPDLNYRSVPSGKELAFYMKNLERQRKP